MKLGLGYGGAVETDSIVAASSVSARSGDAVVDRVASAATRPRATAATCPSVCCADMVRVLMVGGCVKYLVLAGLEANFLTN